MLRRAICKLCCNRHRRLALGKSSEAMSWSEVDDRIWENVSSVMCPAWSNAAIPLSRIPEPCFYAAEHVVGE